MADVLVTTRLDDQVSGKLGSISKETQNLAGASGRINALTASFRGLGGVLGTIGALSLGREFLRLSDEAIRISSRLKLATDSTEEFANAQQRLFQISQETSTRFATNVELYQKLERSTRTLGLSQNELFTITERLSKAVAISGSSAESANAAIIQLTQGLASGQLRGQELNSVLEQATPILETLAQNLNIPIGKFRELAEQGFFTAEVIVKGLLAQGEGTKALERDFAELSLTSEKAFTQLNNALLKVTGVFEEAAGAGSAFSSVVVSLAVALEKLAPFLVELVENTSRGIKVMIEFSQALVDVELRALDAVDRLFSGLRDYFSTRLGDLVDDAAAKVRGLGDAFRDLYHKVVGNSYVPEMLAGIEREFRSLDQVMVAPAERAASRVDASFRGLGKSVVGSASSAVGEIANAFSGLSRFVGDISQIGRVFGIGGRGLSDAGSFIGGLGQVASLFAGTGTGSAGGLLSGAGTGFSLASLAGGLQSPGLANLFVKGGTALGIAGGIGGNLLHGAGLNAPFGIVGGLLGNLLGFTGTGATIGGALGGFAGGAAGGAIGGTALGASLGAFAGPIGAIAGALLGTIFGGLFKSTPPRGHQTLGFSGLTPGVTQQFGKKGFDPQTLNPLSSGLGGAISEIAGALGIQNIGSQLSILSSKGNLRILVGGDGPLFNSGEFGQVDLDRNTGRAAREVISRAIGPGGQRVDPFLHQAFSGQDTLSGQVQAVREAQQAIGSFNESLGELGQSLTRTVGPLDAVVAPFDALRAQAQALQRDRATFDRIEALRTQAIDKHRQQFLDGLNALERELTGLASPLDAIRARSRELGLQAEGLGPAVSEQIIRVSLKAAQQVQGDFLETLSTLEAEARGITDPFKGINDLIEGLIKQAVGLELSGQLPRIEALRATLIEQLEKEVSLRSTLLGLIGPGGTVFSPEGGFQGFLGEGGEILRAGAIIGPQGQIVQGFQHGGDAVFTRPTPILVGEMGPEAVSVTPLSRGRREGRDINVNFNGVTVLDDISAGQLTRILDREFAKRALRFA